MHFHPHGPGHGDAHHHHGHARPTRLIVFFLESDTIPQAIDDQLESIYQYAHALRRVFLEHYGTSLPDFLRKISRDKLAEILVLSNVIRREVMKMADQTPIQPPSGAVSVLFLDDTVGIQVAVLLADDSGTNFFKPSGPLQFDVEGDVDTVTQGVAADGVTPTFLPSGSGAEGTIDVTITDAADNLVGSASFAVQKRPTPPPPPPPGPTQLGVFFVPNSGSAASSGDASGSGGDAAAAAAAAQAAGVATTVDPHRPSK